MRLVEGFLSDWQRWTCGHTWIRARWQDGSYGLRCSHCMKPYHHTWNEIIGGPKLPPASVGIAEVEPGADFGLERAA